jgi:sodium transport system permease protein
MNGTPGPASPSVPRGELSRAAKPDRLRSAWIVFRKELLDALRDRRTLLTVLLSSVALGPLVLALLSTLVAGAEKRAEAREVVVAGIEHAPSLRNYLERQTYVVRTAPGDYETRLAKSRLGDPVVVVPANFESELTAGEAPLIEVVSSTADTRAQGSVGRIEQLLAGFNREQAGLRLVARGVSPELLQAVQVESRDLADPATRAAQLTNLVPFFVLMAVVYGALNAALDTTAGERERGSLEPLLVNPAPRLAIVGGKWAAVALVAMLIAVLSAASFLAGQWLLRSETLAALFRYGWPEALAFVGLLTPLAGALAALLMAIAIRSRSFKEAQASATVVVLVISLLPLVTLFNQEGEAAWHRWAPALAQMTLMGRVLKGEAIGVADVLPSVGVCVFLVAAALAYVARSLARAALD